MTTYRAKRDGSDAEGLTYQPGTVGHDEGDVLAFCPPARIRHSESGPVEWRNVTVDEWQPLVPGNVMLVFHGQLFSVPPTDMEEAFEELTVT